MDRRSAREYAMQVLYQIDVQHEWESVDIKKYLENADLGKQASYVESIISKVSKERDGIDTIINQVSSGWTTGRMAKTDLAIIRLATTEILYLEDVPKPVAINEAVELAKKYGSDQSAGFTNAILGKING